VIQVLDGPSYGFNNPVAVAVDGTSIWIANEVNSVTELDATTGTLIRVLAGPRYKFRVPTAITTDGAHVWVTNGNSDSVTEFPASS